MLNNKIISPIVTEKSMQLVSGQKYTFLVDTTANKLEIIRQIKALYKVNPISVKIINIKGKNVLFRSRYKGKKNDFKKAIVSINKKESIKEFSIKE